jgi:Spy/CpxP family protein refolding chaperone
MTRARLALGALVLLLAAGQSAADPMMGMGRRRGPSFVRQLFVPSVVMRHQNEIGLTDAQRQAITSEMNRSHERLVALRWQLEPKGAALDELLAAERIDEAAAMRQAAELMALEEQMKRTHLELLVRVKNLLTPEQQAKLRALVPARSRATKRPPEDLP